MPEKLLNPDYAASITAGAIGQKLRITTQPNHTPN
jgi:hypothetical protein